MTRSSPCRAAPHLCTFMPRKSRPLFSNSCWSTASTRRWSCYWRTNRLGYENYRAWREGRFETLDTALADGKREFRAWLERAQSWADTLGLVAELAVHHGWEENAGTVLVASVANGRRRPWGARSVATRPPEPEPAKHSGHRTRRSWTSPHGASSSPSTGCGSSRKRTTTPDPAKSDGCIGRDPDYSGVYRAHLPRTARALSEIDFALPCGTSRGPRLRALGRRLRDAVRARRMSPRACVVELA